MAAGALVAIVLILLGVGWYETYVRPYHETVLSVGDQHVDMSYFITRLKSTLPEFAQSDPQVVLQVAPTATLDQIEQELILQQRAPSLGVHITSQDVDAAVAKALGVAVNKQGQPANRDAYEAALRAKLSQTGLSLSQFRQQTEAQLLETDVQNKLAANQPKAVPQAKYSVIAMDTQADAQKILDQLKKGESWNTAAANVRKDPKTGSVADFGFQPKQQVDAALVGPLFSLKANQYTNVIKTSDGKFTIARLVQLDEQHPLTAAQRQTIAPTLYSNWLAQQKKIVPIKESLSDNQKAFALLHANYNPSAQTAPAPQPVVPASVNPPAATPSSAVATPATSKAAATPAPPVATATP